MPHMHSDFSPVLFHFTLSLLSADRFRNSRTGVWSSASPLSFQLAWISSSEISVSKRAVSVSITSTLYRGRTSLISRSAKNEGSTCAISLCQRRRPWHLQEDAWRLPHPQCQVFRRSGLFHSHRYTGRCPISRLS